MIKLQRREVTPALVSNQDGEIEDKFFDSGTSIWKRAFSFDEGY